jgi:hypothetical protein
LLLNRFCKLILLRHKPKKCTPTGAWLGHFQWSISFGGRANSRANCQKFFVPFFLSRPIVFAYFFG